MLGLYSAEGSVFYTRTGTPMSLRKLGRAFQILCRNADVGPGWTTHELRQFVRVIRVEPARWSRQGRRPRWARGHANDAGLPACDPPLVTNLDCSWRCGSRGFG